VSYKVGKDAILKVDSSGGSLVDLSQDVLEFNPTWEVENHDATTLGQAGRKNINGLENHSFSVVYLYDRTAARAYLHNRAIFNISGGATQTFEWYPEGTTSGYPKDTGECRVTKIGAPVKVGDVMQFTVDYKVDGAISLTSA
jgi:hypothetical protein